MLRNQRIISSLQCLAEDVPPSGHAKVIAAIYKGNRQISIGINTNKTHPMAVDYGKNNDAIFLHAEVTAIRNALKRIDEDDLKSATIYIARVKWSDKYKTDLIRGLAKPCEGCMRAILDYGIKKIVYTTDDGDEVLLN